MNPHAPNADFSEFDGRCPDGVLPSLRSLIGIVREEDVWEHCQLCLSEPACELNPEGLIRNRESPLVSGWA